MRESPASRSALCVPHSWGQGSVKRRDRTWLKSKAVFPADLLMVMAISHPSNYIKPQHHFFSWTVFIAERRCNRYFNKVRMAYGEQNWSFLHLGKCVSVHGWLAPQTAPQVWIWRACWEAKWKNEGTVKANNHRKLEKKKKWTKLGYAVTGLQTGQINTKWCRLRLLSFKLKDLHRTNGSLLSLPKQDTQKQLRSCCPGWWWWTKCLPRHIW